MTPARARRSEAGTTLIELIVAVAIMGLAFATILGGIGTAIIGSQSQEQQAGTSLVLRTAAEQIAYQPCADSGTYASALTLPAKFAITTSVSQWNSATNQFEAGLPPSCSPAPSTPKSDAGLQLIQLTVTSTDGRQVVTQSLQVVKRQP